MVLPNTKRTLTRRDWVAEHARLTAADQESGLAAEDLERLAVAAHLLGEDERVVTLRDRAYQEYLARGMPAEAARCVFWVGFHLANAGHGGRASGWLARLKRIVEEADPAGPMSALLLMPQAVQLMQEGDAQQAAPLFEQACATARSAADDDMYTLACLGLGRCLVMLGRPADGVALIDEAMVNVVSGRVAPQVSGMAYCAMISMCMQRFDVERAGEWTIALSEWCDAQAGLVPYRGICRLHRAEILQLHGSWGAAAGEAEQLTGPPPQPGEVGGAAHYRLAELYRLRGRFDLAERSFGAAAACGHEVQPGLALLRLAQGKAAAGIAGLDRALAEAAEDADRPRLLAARTELALSAADLDAARLASTELAGLAEQTPMPYVVALAAHAGGIVLLADGDPQGALRQFRRAWSAWQRVDAPYEAALARMQVGAACRALGDEDAAQMELDAAHTVLQQLGAPVDPAGPTVDSGDGALSGREREVLTLVVRGESNRQIAAALFLSEKTVARHVSNIFGKIGVNSRAAATSYAYQHGLV
jgi:DNA-binding NarL/FixJ family response regulator